MTTKTITLAERPVLDLSLAYFEATHCGIRIIGTWVMDPETRQSQPCIVLLDARRPVRPGKVIPCIIPLDQAWRWTRELGDPEHVANTVADWMACGAMPGQPFNKRDVFAVFDAVQSRLRDLLKMPPLPVKAAIKHGAAPAIGDLVITERESGKVIHEVEVTGHVRH